MSVDNHRHCQLTVLAATGIPPGNGKTWGRISELNLPNLPDGWVETYFKYNGTVTDDLAGILKLLDKVSENVSQMYPGDFISITSGNTVNVKERDFPADYVGTIGIGGSGSDRYFVPKEISIDNKNPTGTPMTTIRIGNKTLVIKALGDLPTERYIVSEDTVYDIVLSGGENDNCPLDYTDEQEPNPRYVVTENGHEYDIGVSGYEDDVILKYNED